MFKFITKNHIECSSYEEMIDADDICTAVRKALFLNETSDEEIESFVDELDIESFVDELDQEEDNVWVMPNEELSYIFIDHNM